MVESEAANDGARLSQPAVGSPKKKMLSANGCVFNTTSIAPADTLEDFVAQLLEYDRLTVEESMRLLKLSQCSQALTIPGNITISRTVTTLSELDVISRVFNTTELLQMILEKLPINDLLLRASRVCKGFSLAIDGSPEIQRILFRQSCSRAPLQAFPLRVHGFYVEKDARGFLRVGYEFSFTPPSITKSESLRRTQITQPLTKYLVVTRCTYIWTFPTFQTRIEGVGLSLQSIYNANGIAFGDIFDWIEKVYVELRQASTSTKVRWPGAVNLVARESCQILWSERERERDREVA